MPAFVCNTHFYCVIKPTGARHPFGLGSPRNVEPRAPGKGRPGRTATTGSTAEAFGRVELGPFCLFQAL
jgi:hypothetical protein